MLENCPIESLIEFDRKEDEIYIQKNVSSIVDGFIARIGRPNFKSDFIGIASEIKKEVDGDKYEFFLEDLIKYYVIHAWIIPENPLIIRFSSKIKTTFSSDKLKPIDAAGKTKQPVIFIHAINDELIFYSILQST